MSDIKFPVALRKMWSGSEVQEWLDNNEQIASLHTELIDTLDDNIRVCQQAIELKANLEKSEKTNLELQFQNNLMMEKQTRTKIPEGVTSVRNAVTGEVKTPAKGEPMPRTIEHYQANAMRDQELILEQKDEIARLKQKINKLEQKK